MPGVNKDGLEVTLEGNELTIVGHRSEAVPGQVLFSECSKADFRRVFDMDPAIEYRECSEDEPGGFDTGAAEI